MYTTSSWRTF